ncbi:testis-expressed protein 26 [Brachyhypopomus gauderio]|uniref:testis-expressed protein 26 n=1 Tax=Brachyhypopomus gauderio TaxID=698409 RepID=UPI00404141A5
MASSDVKKWDPYETSQERHFVYRCNSSTPVLRPLTSKVYGDSYSVADPVGVTAYSEDFCWKPPSKPASIHTGSACGNMRNNPHPSQAFMVWRLPPGLKPCENPPSEEEVRNCLSAQYKSTYRTDFLGIPQGMVTNRTELAPKTQPDVPQYVQTEMRFNYRKPAQKAELQGNTSRYGCNVLHRIAPKGIVPTVVQKHITDQDSRRQMTTYYRHFGGQFTDLSSSALQSLMPEEVQHFYKHLPDKVAQTFMQRSHSSTLNRTRAKEPVTIVPSPPVLDRMSSWPGPL